MRLRDCLNRARVAAIGAMALVSLAGASGPTVQQGADWPAYGGPDENHYSPLDRINAGNAHRLGLIWSHDIEVSGSSMTAPVAVDGILYFAAGLSVVHAIDAASGKLLWRHDPEVAQAAGVELRAAWGSRGIAYANGRVFVGTMDGRLIALDAKTGTVAWTAQTTTKGDGRYISGAPWVFGNKVAIGFGGADFAPVRGYVTAYEQGSGRQAWRFYTVPGDPAKGADGAASDPVMPMAAKTWTGEWWRFGGGGTVWNAMAYDPQFNRLYIGTGNGAPWNRKIRSPGGGDNLFLCSIIALDADTGAYVWHYQTNPGETWDFNSAMDMALTDMVVDGASRPVLLHAPKNGYFYVLDRATGKLISARNYVPVNWAAGIDTATGRPVENPEARFPDGKPAIVYPSPFGAHNIEAMAYNPGTGLAYLPAMDQGRVYIDPPGRLEDWRFTDGQRINNGVGVPPPGLELRNPTSMLIAWNPRTQSEAWRIPMQGPRGGGGTAATAGNLVFQGRLTGQFHALAADTGRDLWSFDAQTAVMAQPITYLAKGRQQVTVIAGARYSTAQGLKQEWDYRTQRWRVLTFALDGTAKLPPADLTPRPYIIDPGFTVDPARLAGGGRIFAERCANCHGSEARSGGTAPHLLRSEMAADAESFRQVVAEGALLAAGMPRFGDLDSDEVESLRHYIRHRARADAAIAVKAIRDDGQ